MLKAVTRQAAAVDAKIAAINAERERERTGTSISTAHYFDRFATPEDIAVTVTEADFMAAHDQLIPSVSAGELAHYEKVRATFEGTRDQQGRATASTGKAGPPTASSNVPGYAPPVARQSSKGKGKAPAVISGKDKGKAVAAGSDDEYGESDDDDGVVSRRSKWKGKAVMGFQDGTASDDDGLY
jgi:peroxin-6